ncbi:predicted protein [Arabidopsis lyrata subsp. lyrata]|uniref:Predicted protein n=1 Tax=Arabidopsis lyrata subsp. lyrata TaxID=81972 RepID=D7LY46_ARALL|nr:predicted protein [Arabidopsis lyrata subsp. lyrata]
MEPNEGTFVLHTENTKHWNWNDFSIGIEGEVFSFSHCYNKVTVAEASGLTGETVQIQDFIREYIKPLAQTCINRLNVRQAARDLVAGKEATMVTSPRRGQRRLRISADRCRRRTTKAQWTSFVDEACLENGA